MLIIQGSHRKNGLTAKICHHIGQETKSEVLHLVDYEIKHFKYHGPSSDDFMSIINQVLEHDEIILATPVYWYTMSGMMKVFLDRISDLLKWDKDSGRKLRGKVLHIVSVSGHDDLHESFSVPFQLTAHYLGMHYGNETHLWGDDDGWSTSAIGRLTYFVEQLKN